MQKVWIFWEIGNKLTKKHAEMKKLRIFRENSENKQTHEKTEMWQLRIFRESSKNKQIHKRPKSENSEFSGKTQKVNKFFKKCINITLPCPTQSFFFRHIRNEWAKNTKSFSPHKERVSVANEWLM